MRFHLLGLAHTVTTEEYMPCAYTQKVYKLSRMLTKLGHEVIHYGADGADVPCEHVTVVSEETKHEAYGNYDWKKEFFKHGPNDLAYTEFNINASREILARKKDGDFLLITFGNYQKPIADAVEIPFTVESGIGYSGVFTRYRVFESYAWMHYIYGVLKQNDGSWYDVVIPNYYDPRDFTLGQEKLGYYAYAGRLIARKGVQVAADTVKHLDGKLVIAGQGDLKDLGLKEDKNIKHVGTINAQERNELFGAATAVFTPTYYIEPFGGVAVEAQLCGTPAITTDWGAYTETVEHGKTGYRCRTFDDFVFAAKDAKNLDSLEIRNHAIANYSMDRVALMYQEYFSKIYDIIDIGWYKVNKRSDLNWLKQY